MKDYNKILYEIEKNKKVLNESEWLEITDYLLNTLEDFLNLSGEIMKEESIYFYEKDFPQSLNREFYYAMEDKSIFKTTVCGRIYVSYKNGLNIDSFCFFVKDKKLLMTVKDECYLRLIYNDDNSWTCWTLESPEGYMEWDNIPNEFQKTFPEMIS